MCCIGLAVVALDLLHGDSAILSPEGTYASVARFDEAAPPTGLEDVAADVNVAAGGAKDAIARRIDMAAGIGPLEADDMRDAFQPPAAWVAASRGRSDGADGSTALAFMQAHKLKAVMVSPEGREAIIDGSCLGVGDRIDGFELVSVGERAVILASEDGSRLTMELPVGAEGSPGGNEE